MEARRIRDDRESHRCSAETLVVEVDFISRDTHANTHDRLGWVGLRIRPATQTQCNLGVFSYHRFQTLSLYKKKILRHIKFTVHTWSTKC